MSSAARNGQRGAEDAGQVLPIHAGQKEHHGGDAGQHQRGAQIGLAHDQDDKNDRNEERAREGVLPVAHLVEPRGEKPGEEQDQHGLGDFRRLEGEEVAEANPAMGVVRAGNEEEPAPAARS